MKIEPIVRKSLWQKLLYCSRLGKGARRNRRLFFEPLEARSLLATITVTRLDDAEGTGDGITLREAILAANTNAAVDGSTAGEAAPVLDTIVFAPGLAGTISLGAGGQLSISETVMIQGNGAANTIIDAQGASRVFLVASTTGDVTLEGMTIKGGKVASSDGGGIRSETSGTLTVSMCIVSQNQTGGSSGGGIFATGPLIVSNSILSGNSSGNGGSANGGAIASLGTVTIDSTTIESNTALSFFQTSGGGIMSLGAVRINNSTIANNRAESQGFGIRVNGGGVYSESIVTILGSTISGNVASARDDVDLRGGGIFASEAVIEQSTVTLNSLTRFDSGTTTLTGGGGVYVVGAATIRGSIVAGNINSAGDNPDLGFGSSVIQASLIGSNSGTNLVGAPVGVPDANGNLVGTQLLPIDPLLGPLTFNGGLTKTHALMASSPAIDAAKNELAVDLIDQRGNPFARIVDGPDADVIATVDMGAYELQTVANVSLVVDTAVDENDGNYAAGDFSLREAIGLANGSVGANTIRFAPQLNGQPILMTLGQLEISDAVTIQGNGVANTIIDAQQRSRVFDILATGGNVTFDGVTVRNGLTADRKENGGGIRDQSLGLLSILNSAIIGNETTSKGIFGSDISFGGGVHALGDVKISGSTISENRTAGSGGGIAAAGSVIVIDSALSRNRSALGGGGIGSDGLMVIVNSTISGNEAASQAGGGLSAGSELIAINSTITGNRTSRDGGGIKARDLVTLKNSILAGNIDTNDGSNSDFSGTGPIAASFSLIGDNSGTGLAATYMGAPDINGNLIGTFAAPIDPNLGPLANNGGPTQTHALLPGSPAIDAGSNDLAKNAGPNGIFGDSDDVMLVNDQRESGHARFVNSRRDQGGATVDMGAFEYNSLVVTTQDDENDSEFNAADLSLREALAISNSSTIDSIFISDSLSGQTITLNLGELTVSKSVKIEGPGASKLAISGGNGATQSRVFKFSGDGANTYILSGITVRDGNGVGIINSGFGGAIQLNDGTDRLVITDSVIRENSANFGGGVTVTSGALEMTNVTVMENSAAFQAGGIFLGNARALLTNVTVSGNTSGQFFGGIKNIANGDGSSSFLLLINSTIVNNQSQSTPTGIGNIKNNTTATATVVIANSIVANNTGGGTQFSNGGTGATFTSLGHNITSDASGNLTGPGDLQNTDPLLLPLDNYDSPLPVHAFCMGFDAPVAGCTAASPALNAGENDLAKTPGPDGVFNNADDAALVTDGRGIPFSRVANDTVDIGAFEYFVNFPPSCLIKPLPEIDDEQGVVTISRFVTNCAAFDPLQTVTYSVEVDRPDLFTTLPSLNAVGTLTFDPAPNVHDAFNLTVKIRDNGGTFDGGGNGSDYLVTSSIEKKHPLFNAAETGARRGLDVTGSTSTAPDGVIVAGDVLGVINYINAKGSGEIPEEGPFGPPYVDVNGDNQVVADDVLKIINWINANPGQSEGEATSTVTFPTSTTIPDDLFLLLATDLVTITSPTRKRA